MKEKYNDIYLISWYLGLQYQEILKMADFERSWLVKTIKQG